MTPTIRDFPDGATAEAMPDGRWICDGIDSAQPVRTSWGEVAAPTLGAYTTRLDPVPGSRRICGHEANGTYVVLYDPTTNQWKRIESTPIGGYSSAFGPDGTLYWIGSSWEVVKTDAGQVAGATAYLGLRQILAGPVVVNMQDTYARADGMFEYTTLGDVTVGHGGGVQEGLIIDHGGKRYQLDTGHTSEVRFNRAGDTLAIAWRKITEQRARIAILTVADLADVPLAKTDEPPPDGGGGGNGGGNPVPEPASLEPQLKAARAKYGATMTSDQCVEMLNRVLYESPDKGWRLFAKPSGAGGTRYDGARCSHDFIVHTGGLCADVLGDAAGSSRVQWGLKPQEGDEKNVDRWVVPIVPQEGEPGGGGGDGGDGDGEPTPVDLKPVVDAIRALADRLQSLEGAVNASRETTTQSLGGLRADIRALEATVETLATRPMELPHDIKGHVSIRVLGTAPLVINPTE